MKRSVITITSILLLIYAELVCAEYPILKMEQVNINPEYYVGITVRFNNIRIEPNPDLFDSTTYFEAYANKIYRYWVWSENNSNLYFGPMSSSYDIGVHSSQALATSIVNSGLSNLSSYYQGNVTCRVGKANGKGYYARPEPYYLCSIISIDITGDNGNVISLTDTGILPTDPIEAAVKAERARWDANGDNKIGLPEAIQALQITSGMAP